MMTVLLLLLLIPAALVVGGTTLVNSAAVRTRIQAAVLQATGHELRIDGPIRIAWSLSPGVEAQAVTLLNPPGYLQPDFASVERIEARVALGALFKGQVELQAVTMEGVEVLLDRDGAGRGNWMPPPGDSRAAPAPVREGRSTVVRQVTIENARIAMLGGPAVTLERLVMAPAGGPVAGQGLFNGVPFAITGHSGPGSADLRAEGGGVLLTASGQSGAWTLGGVAADLASAGPIVGHSLPPMRDVAVSAQLGPAGLSSVHATAGSGDLGALLPGLTLSRLEVTGPAPDQPVVLVAEGKARDLPFALTVNVGSWAALLEDGPVPFQALLVGDEASLGGQGQVANRSLKGLDLVLSGRAPDLARTGALAGVALPALRDAVLEGHLLPAPNEAGALVRGLRLSMQQGDLAGDFAFGTSPRPWIRGSLLSQRLDIDGLRSPATPSAPAAPPSPTTPGPPAAPSAAEPPSRIMRFELLRQADADVRLSVGQLTWRGAVYRAVEARVLLQDGRLRADPLQAVGPGGPMQGQVLADASVTPPTVSLMVRAPGMDAAGLAEAFGMPDAATGAVDVDIQVRAAGADARALMQTADGHVGVALVDGDVANEAMAGALGPALRAANVPVEMLGRSRVRCFAIRMDLAAGQARVPAMAIDAARVRLDADGVVNMVEGTVDLHLRPTIKIGSSSVAVPVRLTGPLTRPVAAVERVAGRFGISIGGLAANTDVCAAALLAARDGRVGTQPR